MKISLSTRLGAIFARDKFDFWFKYATDKERKLRDMDVWQLADVIIEADATSKPASRIVAEHVLSARLARIQSRASWGSGIIGFAGATIGAALGVAVASTFSPSDQQRLAVTCESMPTQRSVAVSPPFASATSVSGASKPAGKSSGSW